MLYNLKIIKISHLDIKPENILVKKVKQVKNEYILKLSDFGESR